MQALPPSLRKRDKAERRDRIPSDPAFEDDHRLVLVGRPQQLSIAGLLGDANRGGIAGVDDAYRTLGAQPCVHGAHRFGSEAAPVRPGSEHPSRLRRGPEGRRDVALEVREADVTDQSPGLFVFRRPQAVAGHRPMADVTQNAAPNLFSSLRTARRVAKNVEVRPQGDAIVEIARAVAAEPQAIGLDDGDVGHGARGYTARAMDADRFNAFEAAGWEEKSAGYARIFGAITARVVPPLLDAARVGTGTRLLDVATGPGYVAAGGAARGASVVGVDISLAMLELARQAHPSIEFHRADAENLPFEAQSFSAVIGNFVILHLGRPERAAAEFARVLAPGGRVALTTWDLPVRMRVLGVFLDALATAGATPPPELPEGPPFFRFSDDDAFADLLRQQGLVDIHVETIEFHQRIESADELWDGALAGAVRTGALILRQSESTRSRIRAAFDERATEYRVGDHLELPVSVKLAAGTRSAENP